LKKAEEEQPKEIKKSVEEPHIEKEVKVKENIE
jgi:hypothetical protein